MSTAELLRARLAPVRTAWLELEQLAGDVHDPHAIEHAAIAGLAMRHLDERAAELDDDQVLDDIVGELERTVYGTAADVELERYGDVDEAVA